MRKLLIMTVSAALGITTSAFAQSAQPAQTAQAAQPQAKPQQQGAKDARDPNEIVCERQQELGSRLATQRVCKTRSEWAEERRIERMNVDKAQMNRDLTH